MRDGFEAISLARRDEYLERLAKCPQKVSDYSFGNLWGWAEEYGLSWRFGESHVWILQTKPFEVFWAPVGPWTDVDWSACPCLAQGLDFIRVPEKLCEILSAAMPDRVRTEEARDHDDSEFPFSVDERWEYIHCTDPEDPGSSELDTDIEHGEGSYRSYGSVDEALTEARRLVKLPTADGFEA